MKQLVLYIFCVFILTHNSLGAYIERLPQQIKQPNGLVINCFVSGDEYYSWLHDSLNYTIILDSKTGYYCYAISQNDELVASKYIVGVDTPNLTGILPGVQLSSAKILKNRSGSIPDSPEEPRLVTKSSTIETVRTINNIVVYVRFSDQSEFDPKQSTYESYFNCADSGANSMYNYFLEASYQKLKIVSSFYPLNKDTNSIISYRDHHIRNYYCPLTTENDSGYSNEKAMTEREHSLVRNAILSLKKDIPSGIKFDSDLDGMVDNICFIIRGDCLPACNTEFNWATLIWPHACKWYNSNTCLRTKFVCRYNFQIESYLDFHQVGVLCHEMFHTLGGGDLYSCNVSSSVGPWDLMAIPANPPQSMCSQYKFLYGGWIKEIPEITESGHYTLNPITSDSNNCYKISFAKPEYFLLEFRQKTGTFESSIPGTGLIIYRVVKSSCCKNIGEPTPYIYVYRPDCTNEFAGSISEAFFDESVGRSTFHNTSNPSCLLSDGSPGNIFIKNIKVNGGKVSFDVRFCTETDVLYSQTDQLPSITNAKSLIKTSGSVLVKSWDSVVFESANEIELNPGFEVKLGGQFETNINYCGNP